MPIPSDLNIILNTAFAELMDVGLTESRRETISRVRDELMNQVERWCQQNPNSDPDNSGLLYPLCTSQTTPELTPVITTRDIEEELQRDCFLEGCYEMYSLGQDALRDARSFCRDHNLQAPYWLTENREVPVSATDYQRFIRTHCVIRLQTPAENLTRRELDILTSLRLSTSPHTSFPPRVLQYTH